MSIVSTKDIAYSNKRAVIKALCEKNALSRVELARELSLSPSTVTTIVQDLLQSKMVEESSERVHYSCNRRNRTCSDHRDALSVSS